MSNDEDRELTDIEREHAIAEKEALRLTEATAAAPQVHAMAKCFTELQRMIREQATEARRIESKLHQLESGAGAAASKIAAAAEARARIATEAVAALAKLLPAAKAQARKGKPALLRLILRASR
jgi:hypothetical protein